MVGAFSELCNMISNVCMLHVPVSSDVFVLTPMQVVGVLVVCYMFLEKAELPVALYSKTAAGS